MKSPVINLQMEGVFFLSDIIFFAIGIVSSVFTAWGNRQAYIRGEYDPNIFRLRQGHEWKITTLIAYFGMILPMYFIKLRIINYFYILISFSILLLTMNILNFKCYKRIRKKRILIYTVINDLFFILITILISYMLFK